MMAMPLLLLYSLHICITHRNVFQLFNLYVERFNASITYYRALLLFMHEHL